MCGIAGWLSHSGFPSSEGVDRALRALMHRGPDGVSVRAVNGCVIGQTRLAIIDLTEAGQEPFPNEDGTAWLTFNGEIYNFMQLRSELEASGHVFRSRTDAEVVLHGYEEWGAGVLDRLRGMFAFAVWDGRRRRLFLARDRVGKKPLFYSQRGGDLLFASELQGLLEMGNDSCDVDLEAIDAYLSWGYIPAPSTGFKGISKLPPGHFLVADDTSDGLTITTERYWSLDYLPKENLGPDEAGERLRDLMTEAVRLRLISDVPLGAFLSGGIDSSIVVGLMAQLSGDPVKTFSIGFEEQSHNELEHARRIAGLWGTDHHEFIVKPDALEVLPLLVRHYGEPFADSSAIPTYYVSKLTRDHVTVALNGDGGDESFAGYERYWANAVATGIGKWPGGAAFSLMASRLIPRSGNSRSSLGKASRFLDAASQTQPQRYARWSSYFTQGEKARLLKPDVRRGVESSKRDWFGSLFDDIESLGPVDAAMSVDVRSYLPFDLLVKVDIAAMASSLECRSPFLDQEVMAFAARLPTNLKVRRGQKKYILKKTFQDLLPTENVERPKMGFAVPVGEWLRGPLLPFLRETLLSSDSRVSDYLVRSAVEEVVAQHLRGTDRSLQVWNLLMLELWFREIVDRAAVRS